LVLGEPLVLRGGWHLSTKYYSMILLNNQRITVRQSLG
jgi:hypothetical protein